MTTLVDVSPRKRLRIDNLHELIGRQRRYDRNTDDYVSRFRRLLRTWRAATAYVSSLDEMFEHPAFASIVQMGGKVVPLIIDELRRNPDLIVGALPIITGEDPVTERDRGDVYAMAVAWIEWGHRRGL